MILTGKTIVAAARPPFPYGGEFISQFLFALQLCWFPMMISTPSNEHGCEPEAERSAALDPRFAGACGLLPQGAGNIPPIAGFVKASVITVVACPEAP